MEYTELTVSTTTGGADAVSALLMRLGATGTQIIDKNDLPDPDKPGRNWELMDRALLDAAPADVQVKAWFAAEDAGRVLEALRLELPRMRTQDAEHAFGTLALSVGSIREEDWANNWKQYYKPLSIGQRLLVLPCWEQQPETDRVVLKLDPGMAFGTGAHHTTRMCLEFLERVMEPGLDMLDMGCGSGILSIAARLLGAKRAVAVDIDPIAETVARDNAHMNGLSQDGYEIYIGNLLADEALRQRIGGPYPVVAANIVADVIIGLAPYAKTVVAPGGWFIVSGIIDDRAAETEGKLKQAGFEVTEVISSDCWYAMLCRNPA